MSDFASAINQFEGFCGQRGYPRTLLWTVSQDILVWRGRLFVLAAAPEAELAHARATFDAAATKGVGVVLDARCKTSTTTICQVYSALDDTDAQSRMIPATGIKMSVAADPPPVTLVRSGALWRILEIVSRPVVY